MDSVGVVVVVVVVRRTYSPSKALISSSSSSHTDFDRRGDSQTEGRQLRVSIEERIPSKRGSEREREKF